MNDGELAHLQVAVAIVLRSPNQVLPPAYWRRRIVDLLARGSLIQSEVAVLNELLLRLTESEDR